MSEHCDDCAPEYANCWNDGSKCRKRTPAYRANFLWPHEDGSVEQAGYEFANAGTEDYRKVWWLELISRIRGG